MAVLAALMGALVLGAGSVQDEAEIDCDAAGSTLELNICAGREVEALQGNLRLYTDAAYALIRQTHEDNPEALIGEIAESERLWNAYVDAACGAVYTNWINGTIRTLMASNCRMELIRERTHHVWREYLVSMEGTAHMPEPELTVYAYTQDEEPD